MRLIVPVYDNSQSCFNVLYKGIGSTHTTSFYANDGRWSSKKTEALKIQHYANAIFLARLLHEFYFKQ